MIFSEIDNLGVTLFKWNTFSKLMFKQLSCSLLLVASACFRQPEYVN